MVSIANGHEDVLRALVELGALGDGARHGGVAVDISPNGVLSSHPVTQVSKPQKNTPNAYRHCLRAGLLPSLSHLVGLCPVNT
jgi:hypothetical protein